jgi:hypothetical protein
LGLRGEPLAVEDRRPADAREERQLHRVTLHYGDNTRGSCGESDVLSDLSHKMTASRGLLNVGIFERSVKRESPFTIRVQRPRTNGIHSTLLPLEQTAETIAVSRFMT